MKCISLTIDNFMGVGHAQLDLADKGLVAIQGVNLDDTSANSNGAGKSSLADALFWCNYGETARDGLGADEVVNRKVGKDTCVTSVWEESDGGRYTVTRWRKKNVDGKKNGVKLTYRDPSAVEYDLTKGTDKLTQAEIDKAIGCSKEVFTAAVYAGQEKLPNLPAMSDGDLKQLIEKASGVDVLVAAYKIARDKLREVEAEQDRWRMSHARIESSLTTANNRKLEMERQRNSFTARNAENIKALTETLKEHVTIAKKRQSERDAIDAERIQREIDKLDAKIAAVESERIEEEALLEDLREAQTRLTTLTAHFNRAKLDAVNQKAKIDGLASQIGQPCGECGKPCEEHDLAEVRKIAEDKLRSLLATAKELKSDLDDQQKVVDRRSQTLTEHQGTRTDISAVVQERKRLAELLATRKRAEDALLNETRSAQRVKAQIEKAKSDPNPFVELVKNAVVELEEAGMDFRESETLGTDLEKRIMIAKDVVKVFGPAGVRAHVLDTVTPFLNDRTADYLGVMSDGTITAVWQTLSLNAKGELTEKFAINVQKDLAGGSFASLSGGEKRKVRLACALALQDLVASRANKPLELIVYDEVDDALDESGLERLMNIFEKKGREKGSVIIISHNSLSDWVRENVVVTMKDGISSVDAGICAPSKSSPYLAESLI